jgi:energy-coupling factor transport system permease protein
MVSEKPSRRVTLDPRTHLALGLMAMVLIVTADRWRETAVLGAAIGCTLLLRRVWKDLWRWLRAVLPMVIFFGGVTAAAFDLSLGVMAGLKLLWLTLVGFLLFVSTAPEDLANALIRSGVPFRAAFVVSAGMQFVPVLARKARAVLEAQQSRGIPIATGWRAIRHYPALALPLLIQSFQLAEELAEAMESRGFGRAGRTFYRETRLGKWDWAVMLAGGIVTGIWVWGSKR